MTSENPEPTAAESAPSPPLTYSGAIVARYGRYFRNARYALTVLLIGFGLWCINDGFFKFPRENADAVRRGQPEPHGKYDAPLNKLLGVTLPPLGIFVLIRMLYKSRGEIRLDDQALHAPGHPTIPLTSIRRIDISLWDRKDIAYVDYEVGEPPARGRVTLDAFVYEAQPIAEIVKRIEDYAASVTGTASAASDEPASESERA
jgi:hypothetical protein